jgi:hypothetical protein
MASRKEEKERRRQERIAQEQAAREQERRRRVYAIFAGGGLSLAAVVAIIVVVAAGGGGGGGDSGGSALKIAATKPPPTKTNDLVSAAKAAGCKLSNPPIEGRTHVTTPVKYHTNPPSSGNHNPVPAADGAYAKSPGIYHLVHSLEHGRIELQWAPSTPQRRLAQLKGLFDEDPYHMILTPNTTHMPFQVAAVAWGHIAGCKRFTDDAFDVFRAFRTRYIDKGPEFIP